jgi:hypothetical protein
MKMKETKTLSILTTVYLTLSMSDIFKSYQTYMAERVGPNKKYPLENEKNLNTFNPDYI